MPKQPQDFRSKLAKATLPERTVTVYLNGAVRAEYDQCETELAAMTNDGTARLGGNPRAAELARRMNALRDEMADSQVDLRLRALKNVAWMQLLTDHAPRKDNEGDAAVGFDQSTFFTDMVRASIVDPALDDTEFEALIDALNSRQFDEVSNVAWALNRGEVRVPFSALAFETLRNLGETSKPQSGSGSARAGSRAGNRKRSPDTATTTTDA